jgi:hypothetical protein
LPLLATLTLTQRHGLQDLRHQRLQILTLADDFALSRPAGSRLRNTPG